MREKTTIYIEENLKKKVQIKLIENEGQVSLSTLINKLLEEWYQKETSQDLPSLSYTFYFLYTTNFLTDTF